MGAGKTVDKERIEIESFKTFHSAEIAVKEMTRTTEVQGKIPMSIIENFPS